MGRHLDTPERRAYNAAWMRDYRARRAAQRPVKPPKEVRPARPAMTTDERFWAWVDVTGDCWTWMAARNRFGYGVFSAEGRSKVLAHRFSWAFHNGPIPDGMFVLHSCDNPPCVNPEHLWLGTKVENNRDRDLKGRTYRLQPTAR